MRVWDPVSLRRAYSWLLVVFRDLIGGLVEYVSPGGFGQQIASKVQTVAPSAMSVGMIPSFCPSQLLVLLVTSALFVF